MSPTEIDLARRIIACGLPVPRPRHRSFFDTDAIVVKLGSEVVATCHNAGSTDYDPATRILWQVVTTDTGPELLPVLEDYALLGWIITELGRVSGKSVGITPYLDDWVITAGPNIFRISDTRIEALVAALEAARKEA